MNGRAITFDFHDTLAHCDPWFDLEIRTLVSAWLRWEATQAARTLDPTHADAADAAYRRLRQAIVDHGQEETAERCVALVLAELGMTGDDAAIDRGVENVMREAFSEVRPVTGSVETVRAIAAAGVPLGVVSSAVYHPFLEWTLTSFGIRDAFADVTTSASAGFYKSRPEIYWHALGRIGGEPAKAVHVGDSLRWDVGGAHEAGMRAVWLRKPDAPESHDAWPELTLETLAGAAPAIIRLLDDRAEMGRS